MRFSKCFYEVENFNEVLEYLKENGYKYIVKAGDKFLSGWGMSENKKHIHLIACKSAEDREKVYEFFKNNDSEFNYANWTTIDNKRALHNFMVGKTWNIATREDWTRIK
jgi:hypothetical protein